MGNLKGWTRAAAVLLSAVALTALLAAPAGAAKTKVTWYGQAAFKIETAAGAVIMVDPWLTNPKNPDKSALDKLTRVDYILLTHAHGDHVGNSVQIAKKTGAALVTSAGLRRNIIAVHGFPEQQATAATAGNVGGRVPLPKVKGAVTFVNAIHGSELQFPKGVQAPAAAVIGGNPIGFVLELDDGPTIYHTGDTDVFTDMKLIDEFFDVDVMLASIGDHYTMGPTRAALAVEFVQPKVVVPMHFGTFGLLTGRPAPFEAAMKQRGLSTRMVEMQPGDTRTF